MNTLLSEVLNRLLNEIKVTIAGGQESVLAISERVNRKTQTLRFHWRAATLRHQIESEYQRLGHMLYNGFSSGTGTSPTLTASTADMDTRLFDAVGSIQLLKKELKETEASIRNVEAEVLHEDFVSIQRDLLSRTAGMSRVVITAASSALERPVKQLQLPPMTRVAGMLRGSVLLSPMDDSPLRSGDILILLGPQPEVQLVAEALRGIEVKHHTL